MITGAQMRAARGILSWSTRELADTSGVSVSTIKRMEEADDVPNVMAGNLVAVQKALEEAGVSFIPANGGKAGVRPR